MKDAKIAVFMMSTAAAESWSHAFRKKLYFILTVLVTLHSENCPSARLVPLSLRRNICKCIKYSR